MKVGDLVDCIHAGSWEKKCGIVAGGRYTITLVQGKAVKLRGATQYWCYDTNFKLFGESMSDDANTLDELISSIDKGGYREVGEWRWGVGKRKRKGLTTIVCQSSDNNPLVVGYVADIPALCATLLKIKREAEE